MQAHVQEALARRTDWDIQVRGESGLRESEGVVQVFLRPSAPLNPITLANIESVMIQNSPSAASICVMLCSAIIYECEYRVP